MRPTRNLVGCLRQTKRTWAVCSLCDRNRKGKYNNDQAQAHDFLTFSFQHVSSLPAYGSRTWKDRETIPLKVLTVPLKDYFPLLIFTPSRTVCGVDYTNTLCSMGSCQNYQEPISGLETRDIHFTLLQKESTWSGAGAGSEGSQVL